MTGTLDGDLYERARALLEPGEIRLNGAVVHTALGGDRDLELHELTVDLNDVVAANDSKGESYIYAGNDDPEFASNQFQGRTLEGDAFVWECQHLLRDGTFDVVLYYEATADHGAILSAIRDLEGVREVVGVEG